MRIKAVYIKLRMTADYICNDNIHDVYKCTWNQHMEVAHSMPVQPGLRKEGRGGGRGRGGVLLGNTWTFFSTWGDAWLFTKNKAPPKKLWALFYCVLILFY